MAANVRFEPGEYLDLAGSQRALLTKEVGIVQGVDDVYKAGVSGSARGRRSAGPGVVSRS